MWKSLEQFFTFTRSERNAIVALVILVLLILIVPRAYFLFKPVQHTTNPEYEKQVEAFAKTHSEKPSVGFNKTDSAPAATAVTTDSVPTPPKRIYKNTAYFNFDPNKIGVKEWVQLGFSERQAESIEKYKAKGGKFYRPDDLKRLYVMTDEHFEKLVPYVKIDVSALPPRKYRRSE